jgi:hypothetical protein
VRSDYCGGHITGSFRPVHVVDKEFKTCFTSREKLVNILITHKPHVKWVHCHHAMERPRVADRRDGIQIWRVAVNMLNKQSQTADSGWSSRLGVGRGANTPPQ